MIKHVLSLCVFAAIALLPAGADESGNGFCANAPLEMVKAIEGRWTLTQGAGVAVGGFIPIPLPAQAPQSVSIDVDGNSGIAFLKHEGQKLAIVPVLPEQAVDQMAWLRDDEIDGLTNPGGACDWYALPVMLGSNIYALNAETAAAEAANTENEAYGMIFAGNGQGDVHVCSNGKVGYSVYSSKDVAETGGGPTVGVISEDDEGAQNAVRLKCALEEVDVPVATSGEMTMTLFVKFTSPNSGAGVLQFQGEQEGYRFGARAPITFAR